MLGLDEPHAAAVPIKEDRVGQRRARDESHALEQLAVRHAGGDEADVLAARELVGPVNALLVGHPHLLRAGALFIVAKLQPTEDLATETAERGRGEHAL